LGLSSLAPVIVARASCPAAVFPLPLGERIKVRGKSKAPSTILVFCCVGILLSRRASSIPAVEGRIFRFARIHGAGLKLRPYMSPLGVARTYMGPASCPATVASPRDNITTTLVMMQMPRVLLRRVIYEPVDRVYPEEFHPEGHPARPKPRLKDGCTFRYGQEGNESKTMITGDKNFFEN